MSNKIPSGLFTGLLIFIIFTAVVFQPPTLLSLARLENEEGGIQTGPSKYEELQELIKQKTDDLRKIEEESVKLQAEVDQITEMKSVLSREISAINYNLNQLNLSIKSNKINVEKISLELEAIDESIELTKTRAEEHKKTIGKLMLQLYQRDRDDFLLVFLRNPTLARGVSEVQSIVNLNSDLTVSISELRNFQKDLTLQSAFARQKQAELEVEKQNFEYRQQIAADQRAAKETLLNQTKVEERAYVEQLAQLNEQQKEIGAIIDEAEKILRANLNPDLIPIKRPGVLAYPLQGTIITQAFGATEFAKTAYKSKTHNGLDFGARIGTPVMAAEDGMVRAVDNNDVNGWRKYQYGKYVVLDHTNNLSTLYGHLSRALVKAGDIVKQGEIIGYTGNTGYSTGPHLHFGVYLTQTVLFKKVPPAKGLVPIGAILNPADYL